MESCDNVHWSLIVGELRYFIRIGGENLELGDWIPLMAEVDIQEENEQIKVWCVWWEINTKAIMQLKYSTWSFFILWAAILQSVQMPPLTFTLLNSHVACLVENNGVNHSRCLYINSLGIHLRKFSLVLSFSCGQVKLRRNGTMDGTKLYWLWHTPFWGRMCLKNNKIFPCVFFR